MEQGRSNNSLFGRLPATRTDAEIVVAAHHAHRKVSKAEEERHLGKNGKLCRIFAMFGAWLKSQIFPDRPTGRTLRLLSCRHSLRSSTGPYLSLLISNASRLCERKRSTSGAMRSIALGVWGDGTPPMEWAMAGDRMTVGRALEWALEAMEDRWKGRWKVTGVLSRCASGVSTRDPFPRSRSCRP
jgi:hypothetical protein